MISREKRKEYVKAAGSFCINCGSGNISAGKIESEGREEKPICMRKIEAKLSGTLRYWPVNCRKMIP